MGIHAGKGSCNAASITIAAVGQLKVPIQKWKIALEFKAAELWKPQPYLDIPRTPMNRPTPKSKAKCRFWMGTNYKTPVLAVSSLAGCITKLRWLERRSQKMVTMGITQIQAERANHGITSIPISG
jgi:hypothetical protein